MFYKADKEAYKSITYVQIVSVVVIYRINVHPKWVVKICHQRHLTLLHMYDIQENSKKTETPNMEI